MGKHIFLFLTPTSMVEKDVLSTTVKGRASSFAGRFGREKGQQRGSVLDAELHSTFQYVLFCTRTCILPFCRAAELWSWL